MVLFLFVTWEQRKLGDTIDFYSGLTYSPSDIVKDDGVFVLRSCNVQEGEIVDDDNVYVRAGAVNSDNVSVDDIIVVVRNGSRSLIGKHAKIKKNMPKTVIGAFMTGLRYKNSAYLNAVLNTSIFEREIEKDLGATINQITIGAFRKMVFPFPKQPEQLLIGNFFEQIDNLITLHQRKQKYNFWLFMTSKVGLFLAHSWEQRKVSELLIERNEQAPKSREYPLMAFIANEGVASKGDRYDRSSLVNDTENKPYKKTEYGDFIYSSNNLETGSIGVNKYGKASISPVYSIFYTTKLADSDFVGRRLVRRDFINEMVKWRQGVIYGQWRIHEDDFVKIEIFVPKVDEQHKIGTILDNLDNLITLHQRKDFLSDCHSAVLNAEVKSKKVANAWEQRKLSEIANIKKGQQLGKAEMSSTGAYYVLNGGMEASGFSNQYNTPANTISISEGGNSCGYVSLNLEHFWSGGHNYTLQNLKINTIFLYQWLKRHEKRIMALRVGSGLPNIQKSSLQDVDVTYSNATEQQAIALFLIKIDNLITLHQREHSVKKSSKLSKKHLADKVLFANAWEQRKLGDVFDYERPDAYIVRSDKYSDTYSTPVLTANKGFILGYTNETKICNKECIIFDDFTLDSKYVTFPFMVKSSALKILAAKMGYFLPFAYQLLQATNIEILGHARHYISVVQPTKVLIPSSDEQIRIGKCIQQLDNLITLHQRGLIKIQGDKNGKKRSFRRIVQRLF